MLHFPKPFAFASISNGPGFWMEIGGGTCPGQESNGKSVLINRPPPPEVRSSLEAISWIVSLNKRHFRFQLTFH